MPNGSGAGNCLTPQATLKSIFQEPAPILGGSVREIRVTSGLGGDFATLTAALSGTGGLNKTGTGELDLRQATTHTSEPRPSLPERWSSMDRWQELPSRKQAGAALGGSGSIVGDATVARRQFGQLGHPQFCGWKAIGTLTLSDPQRFSRGIDDRGHVCHPVPFGFRSGSTPSADRDLVTNGKLAS